ncbi:hypothetical protein [Nocardiopsis oceani]
MERRRVIWLGAAVVLLVVGAAAWGADASDGVYYRLRAVPFVLVPLAWTVAAVLILSPVARAARDHRRAWLVCGGLLLGLALLLWPYTAFHYLDKDRHVERERAEIDGYVLVLEQRFIAGASVPECGLYLRQDGGPLSRETAVTTPVQGSCSEPRASEDGAGFELVTREGETAGEVDPADHF